MNQSIHITRARVRRMASFASVAAFVVGLVGATANPAAAQCGVPPGGEAFENVICGTVTTTDGAPVPNVDVTATFSGGDSTATTNSEGVFVIESLSPETYTVTVNTSDPDFPSGSEVTPSSIVVNVTLDAMDNPTQTPGVDFEVSVEPQPGDIWGPGTGTPGYWKNHPEAWPDGITIGGVPYTTAEAIAKMGKVSGDKTYSMFAALVSAILNTTVILNNPACISDTITSANGWMTTYQVGSGVKASSTAWQTAAHEWHQRLDDYNNGKLCAPHRG
jgi:hypothetical protein